MSIAEAVPGLTYVDDAAPGYSRRRRGRGFSYLDTRGRVIRDARTVDRLRRLAVPPAWTDVWLCPDPNGHIQATGRDAKGRKQYRYHADWQLARDEAKFDSLVDFGHSLPILRTRVAEDIRRRDLSFDRVVATTVWLLDRTLIRVGNAEYAKDSYGLTTLLDQHVDVTADTITFRFVGKSGKQHDLVLSDRRVAKIVSQCQDLPGQQLLQYVTDDEDAVRGIGSRDVNEYIREATHTAFTAKTFRTWGASAYTLGELHRLGPADTEREAQAQVRQAVKDTAELLRNTATVCRQSYIHPRVPESHVDGSLHTMRKPRARTDGLMDEHELRLLTLLDGV